MQGNKFEVVGGLVNREEVLTLLEHLIGFSGDSRGMCHGHKDGSQDAKV